MGRLLQSGDLLALVGDLGAGKTWLTRAIAEGMGVRDEVTSPTFPLIQEYSGPIPMFHFDPYRLERPEEILDLGFEEYLERAGVVVIEWADLLSDFLPTDRLTLTLTMEDESEAAARRLSAQAQGARSETLLKQLMGLSEPAGETT